MAPSDHTLTLITRVGCHLCEQAETVLERVGAELGVPVRQQDVDADRELLVEYGDRVPVILLDGKEHGYWRVEEARLRRDLAR